MKSLYHRAICSAMEKIAQRDNTIFLGQQVACQDFYGTLKNVSEDKRIEMPVAEELQTGIAIGLALEGYLPISIYQRMDFLPRACDQLINHLSKIDRLSGGLFKPKVIIRTTVGTTKPLNVGLQHSQDLTDWLKQTVNFPVIKVTTPQEVEEAYNFALSNETSVAIIELQELYGT